MSLRIFARNFRGFRSISLPIDGNLFFVGENSSGKSSALHLINTVLEKDLIGMPFINSDYHVDREDIFSPYFDYADVEIGFIHATETTGTARVVTVTRDRKENLFHVSACSTANELGVLSTRIGDDNLYHGRFRPLERLPTEEEILDVHRDESDFTSLSSEIKGLVNDFETLTPALIQLVKDEGNLNQYMSLVFNKNLPIPRHVGPMRGAPEGFYLFERRMKPTGGHFATLLDDISRTDRDEIDLAVKKFGLESELFENLTVMRVAEKIPTSPLGVFVTKNGKDFMLNQVGIGVSQIAPIIAETLAAEKGLIGSDVFLIQQPELHLHPKAQAALGDYLYSVSQKGISFCLETHSDFLIDRYRTNIPSGSHPCKDAIVYFKNTPSGNVYDLIHINDDGKLSNPPSGYLDFFINELARTM